MKRVLLTAACLATMGMLFTAAPAKAGSPHFVACTVTLNADNTATATGKEAGLGNETQVMPYLQVVAGCINGGGNHPKASNKTGQTVSLPTEPVQNGKADYTATSSTQVTTNPPCNPPMTLAILSATIFDAANPGISLSCTIQ